MCRNVVCLANKHVVCYICLSITQGSYLSCPTFLIQQCLLLAKSMIVALVAILFLWNDHNYKLNHQFLKEGNPVRAVADSCSQLVFL